VLDFETKEKEYEEEAEKRELFLAWEYHFISTLNNIDIISCLRFYSASY
jgi:hypothetical protein